MDIIVFAATEAEVKPFADHLSAKSIPVQLVYTGVGLAASCYAITKSLIEQKPDLVIQAGIAGSFDREIQIGEVVCVQSECFGQLGARSADAFLDVFTLGLSDPDAQPYTQGRLQNPHLPAAIYAESLRSVRGVTVETTSGHENDIRLLKAHFDAEIETMEGAAFFYSCLMQQTPFAALRSISNMVEERNTANWNIPLAVSNLNKLLIRTIEQML